MRNKLLKISTDDNWSWVYLNGKLVEECHDFDLFNFFSSYKPSLSFYSEDIEQVLINDYISEDHLEIERDKIVDKFFKNESKTELVTFNSLLNSDINLVSFKYYFTGLDAFAYLIQDELTQLIKEGSNISYIECSHNCFERIREVIPNQIRSGFNDKNYYKTNYGFEVELRVK